MLLKRRQQKKQRETPEKKEEKVTSEKSDEPKMTISWTTMSRTHPSPAPNIHTAEPTKSCTPSEALNIRTSISALRVSNTSSICFLWLWTPHTSERNGVQNDDVMNVGNETLWTKLAAPSYMITREPRSQMQTGTKSYSYSQLAAHVIAGRTANMSYPSCCGVCANGCSTYETVSIIGHKRRVLKKSKQQKKKHKYFND